MTDKKIRKAAKRSILNGKTKQETFEELKGKNYKSAKKRQISYRQYLLYRQEGNIKLNILP